jgi:Tfp pilus assembly protein PilN
MTRINLLPPELIERQRARRQTTIVAVVGFVVILLLGFFYVLQQIKLSGLEERLAEQQATNDELAAQVNDLRRFDELLAEIAEREDLLVTLLENEVRWSGVLRDLSLVIPGTAWLETLEASIDDPLGPVAAQTTLVPVEEDIVGAISFVGHADRHPTVAEWLTALEKIRGFLNPWISESILEEIGEVPVVKFTSSVDLTVDITVEGRAQQ